MSKIKETKPTAQPGVRVEHVVSCLNCKNRTIDDDRASASYGDHFCIEHDNYIDNMFDMTKYSMHNIACKQFKRGN